MDYSGEPCLAFAVRHYVYYTVTGSGDTVGSLAMGRTDLWLCWPSFSEAYQASDVGDALLRCYDILTICSLL